MAREVAAADSGGRELVGGQCRVTADDCDDCHSSGFQEQFLSQPLGTGTSQHRVRASFLSHQPCQEQAWGVPEEACSLSLGTWGGHYLAVWGTGEAPGVGCPILHVGMRVSWEHAPAFG